MESNVKKININIWETKFKDNFLFLNSYDELIKYMDDNAIFNFDIYDSYVPGNPRRSLYDRIANRDNIHLTYTDEEHPVTIINGSWSKKIFINSNFYKQYMAQLKEFIKKRIIEEIEKKPFSIYIPDFVFDDELLNIIISDDRLKETFISIIDCVGVYLSEEQLKKLSQSHLEVSLKGEKISSKHAIRYKTWSDLENSDSLCFDDNLNDNEIANFIYINEKCVISIDSENENDERKYIENLVRIFSLLQSHNRSYNIKISVNNRELLMQSGLLNFPNINLTINNDLYDYKKEEFLKEDEQLEKLVKPIREADLSPYEKYLAVYNIVKQFKPYKENDENKDESRSLRYILNNEYMVCVGYAKLLTTLLDKVGISAYSMSGSINTSYDKGVPLEDKPTELAGHRRNIIKIDDDKYGIHGIFIADATWDNDMELDLYNNSAMTFDRKKEAIRLETLTDEDLLLDFHNFEEFSQKINYYLKKKIAKSFWNDYNDKVFNEFKYMYNDILKRLACLDYQKYSELFNKYNELINKNNMDYRMGKVSLKDVETVYNQFLTDYASYIIPLSNKAISNETLLSALTELKKKLGNYGEEELRENLDKIEAVNAKIDSVSFPYVYDPNNPIPNYLETRTVEESSGRSK